MTKVKTVGSKGSFLDLLGLKIVSEVCLKVSIVEPLSYEKSGGTPCRSDECGHQKAFSHV